MYHVKFNVAEPENVSVIDVKYFHCKFNNFIPTLDQFFASIPRLDSLSTYGAL